MTNIFQNDFKVVDPKEESTTTEARDAMSPLVTPLGSSSGGTQGQLQADGEPDRKRTVESLPEEAQRDQVRETKVVVKSSGDDTDQRAGSQVKFEVQARGRIEGKAEEGLGDDVEPQVKQTLPLNSISEATVSNPKRNVDETRPLNSISEASGLRNCISETNRFSRGDDIHLRVGSQVKFEVEARGRLAGKANGNADDEGRASNPMAAAEKSDGFIQVQHRRKRRKAKEREGVEFNRCKSNASEEHESRGEEVARKATPNQIVGENNNAKVAEGVSENKEARVEEMHGNVLTVESFHRSVAMSWCKVKPPLFEPTLASTFQLGLGVSDTWLEGHPSGMCSQKTGCYRTWGSRDRPHRTAREPSLRSLPCPARSIYTRSPRRAARVFNEH